MAGKKIHSCKDHHDSFGNHYQGEEGFTDKLLGLLDKTAEKLRGKNSHASEALRAHHQSEAAQILSILARELGLPDPRRN